MGKILHFEDKYYVYVPTQFFKLSKQEWEDFKEKNGPPDKFRYQDDLVESIRRFRNLI